MVSISQITEHKKNKVEPLSINEMITGSTSKSGNPCDKFMAPFSRAS